MISYIFGKIIIRKDKYIVVETNNIGYKVFLSQKTFSKIPEIGQDIKLFCHLDVKENSLTLYGFLSVEELEFFEMLGTIRGIGPKAGLEISVLGPLEKIKDRVLNHDEDIFEGIPGIGKKKAMTIILELSGKIKDLSKNRKVDEAEEAIVNLGFTRQQAKEALKGIPLDLNSEERIKRGLSVLGS